MTLEQSIFHYAQTAPDRVAAVCGSDSISYSELRDAIARRAEELHASGLQPHRPYTFRATQDIDFLITYCAIHYAKAIAVPLEHKATEESFQSIKSQVEGCSFAEDIVDVLYTTGTTGKSKGVMLSERALVACTDNFIADLHFSEELLFIISGPLNHIASLFKIHPTLSAGGTVCILDGLKDMSAFFSVFDLPFKKVATFLVPASIRLIMQLAYDKLCAVSDKIDFIETGAAPITKQDMEQLSKALPSSRLYNTLGGTEIGAVCTYNFNDGRYMEGCIGRPMKNSVVEISEEGNLVVSGPTIMSGYVADQQSTSQVLKDGKIYTADLGYVDDEGLIHLTGRQGDVINIGGFKVSPSEVEAAAISHPDIKDCICIAATHPVIGQVLKLLYVPCEGCELKSHAIARHIKTLVEPHKVPTYYEAVETVQRTYNGKLDRKYYKN